MKGARVQVSGELLNEFIRKMSDVPKDAKIFKVVPGHGACYNFDILYFSEEGYEIPEMSNFPIKNKED